MVLTSNKNPGKDPEQYNVEDLNMMNVQSKLEYEPLMNWAMNFIQMRREDVEREAVNTEMTHIDTATAMRKNCGTGANSCMIALVDGSRDNSEEYVETLKSLGYYIKGQMIDLYWLDAACHVELLMQLDITP
jgi:hypothetical protein